MESFSLSWAFLITLLFLFFLFFSSLIIFDKKRRLPLYFMLTSLYIYSAIGISFDYVAKINILYYSVFSLLLIVFYLLFTQKGLRLSRTFPQGNDEETFWESGFCKKVFISFVILYFLLRFAGIITSGALSDGVIINFDSHNNINNLTGGNSTVFDTIAVMISPFFYIGLYYLCSKVRYVAVVLLFEALLTLIKTGYLTRHILVGIAIICFLMYVYDDFGSRTKAKKKISKTLRISVFFIFMIPVMIYVLLYMMGARISSDTTFSLFDLIKSEINYPKHYDTISKISPLVNVKDFFLQLLDTLVPVIPTPSYHMDLNVDFSTYILGYGPSVSYFSVQLPSLLGESFLLFGYELYWLHAIIIAILIALIYKVAKRKQLSVLFYYYLSCVLKTGRAGYAELTQSVLLNLVILLAGISFLKLLWRTNEKQNG